MLGDMFHLKKENKMQNKNHVQFKDVILFHHQCSFDENNNDKVFMAYRH